MADKTINQLTQATDLTDSSLFVIEQNSTAKQANWGMMKNYISPGVAAQYSTSATYNVGDYVIYNGSLYRCNTAITTGEAWTAAHWTAAVLGNDVGELKSDLLYRAVDNIDIGLFEKGSFEYGADSTWGQNARIRTKILLALNDFYISSVHQQAKTIINIFDSSGSYVSTSGWQFTYTIKQGTIFRLMLGGNYTSTTEELSISEIFSRFQIFTISENEKINNTVAVFNSQDEFADIDFSSAPFFNGVNILFDGEKFVVNGTTSAAVNFNIYLDATKLPGKLSTSDLITWNIKRSSSSLVLVRYIQTTDDSTWHGDEWLTSFVNADGVYQEIIDDNVTGWLLRIYIPANVTLSNDYLKFSCTREQPNTIAEESGPVIAANTNIKHTKLIEDTLAKYGCVTIGKGTHIINNLHMPDNSTIRGCGNSSILQTSDSTAHGIIPGTYCTIEDIKIVGTRTGTSASRTNDAGIYIVGNYDESPIKRNTKINNCFIYGFGLAGIYGKSTGYWVADSISATNCEICVCYAGILLEDFCEFNRFTNMLCYSNYVGLMNRSGNNVFVNCSFSNNTVGIYLNCNDADHALSGNNGHGAVIGATINHSNNNNGYGIIVKGVESNGFTFDSCQIWYSKVQVENSSGVVVQGCTFGGGTPVVESYSNTAFFLRNNLFKAAPTLTGAMIKDGNYLFDGTAVV